MIRIFHNTSYDFIRWWRVAAALTIAFIAIGLGSFAIKPQINFSIEFTGGSEIQIKFAQPPASDAAAGSSTVATRNGRPRLSTSARRAVISASDGAISSKLAVPCVTWCA